MSGAERRAEIIRILMGRGTDTVSNLACALGVNERTIRRDLLTLTVDEHYPIDTIQGNGGGVRLHDWRHPHKRILSREQETALTAAIDAAQDAHQAGVLRGILNAYGTPIDRRETHL